MNRKWQRGKRKQAAGNSGITEHKESGLPGMSRYITTKNRKNTPDRLERRKYNPVMKKHTLHREIK